MAVAPDLRYAMRLHEAGSKQKPKEIQTAIQQVLKEVQADVSDHYWTIMTAVRRYNVDTKNISGPWSDIEAATRPKRKIDNAEQKRRYCLTIAVAFGNRVEHYKWFSLGREALNELHLLVERLPDWEAFVNLANRALFKRFKESIEKATVQKIDNGLQIKDIKYMRENSTASLRIFSPTTPEMNRWLQPCRCMDIEARVQKYFGLRLDKYGMLVSSGKPMLIRVKRCCKSSSAKYQQKGHQMARARESARPGRVDRCVATGSPTARPSPSSEDGSEERISRRGSGASARQRSRELSPGSPAEEEPTDPSSDETRNSESRPSKRRRHNHDEVPDPLPNLTSDETVDPATDTVDIPEDSEIDASLAHAAPPEVPETSRESSATSVHTVDSPEDTTVETRQASYNVRPANTGIVAGPADVFTKIDAPVQVAPLQRASSVPNTLPLIAASTKPDSTSILPANAAGKNRAPRAQSLPRSVPTNTESLSYSQACNPEHSQRQQAAADTCTDCNGPCKVAVYDKENMTWEASALQQYAHCVLAANEEHNGHYRLLANRRVHFATCARVDAAGKLPAGVHVRLMSAEEASMITDLGTPVLIRATYNKSITVDKKTFLDALQRMGGHDNIEVRVDRESDPVRIEMTEFVDAMSNGQSLQTRRKLCAGTSPTRAPDRVYNALHLNGHVGTPEPPFMQKKFRYLADLKKRAVEQNVHSQARKKSAVLNALHHGLSCSFDIAATAGAFSGFHVDMLGNTWLECQCGSKLFFLAINPDDADWRFFTEKGDAWPGTEGKVVVVPMGPGDILINANPHAVLTLEPAVMTGGMFWHRDPDWLTVTLTTMLRIVNNGNLSNESIPEAVEHALSVLLDSSREHTRLRKVATDLKDAIGKERAAREKRR